MRRYGLALIIIAATLLVRVLMQPLWETTAPFALFMLATTAAAWFAGTGPALLTGAASLAARVYFDSPTRGVEPVLLFTIFCAGIVLIFERMRRDRLAVETTIAQLRKARDEAEEASRLKDDFLALVSHELRTPLNAILGWVSLLQSGALSEARAAHALDIIKRNADVQAQLVSDLLDVARSLTGKMELHFATVDLAEVVESAVESIAPAAAAREIQLVVDVAARPHVRGDAGRLTQAIWNLLSNAVKFTPPGGRVRLEARMRQHDVELVVDDTGIGIEREFLPRVFERFTQGDTGTMRRHGGLGLGLALVRHIVELHGGSVIAESEGPSRGARFTLLLPLFAPAHRDADVQRLPATERMEI